MIRPILGDSREVLKTLPDASLDACVTDPPYDLRFMGKAWDTGDTAHDPAFWREVYRVLKPGAHLVAFAGSGTTGIAAMAEGFDAVLIEREEEYFADIERRITWAKGRAKDHAPDDR